MVQSIELLLDPDSENAVRAEWDALASVDLPSLATQHAETNRPHVTLAVADAGLEGAEEGLRAVFRGWELTTEGVAGIVGSPVLFGGHRGRWVLARQVVPSRPLLTLHSAVHRALSLQAPDVEVVEQTLPDEWTAHVSLARRVPAARVPEALGLIGGDPIPCRFTAARLWDSRPATVTPLT
jgi:2'-5' RNA ligase superfamily